MPVDLEIIRASEFIRMGSLGEFDLVATCAVLSELARACNLRGIHRALLDIRQAQAKLTPTELAALVETYREIGFTRNHRLAILHSGDPHHRARTFAFIGRLRGWMVEAFDDFEEAVYWLSFAEKPVSKQAPGRRPPISRVRDEPSFARHRPEPHQSVTATRRH